MADTLLVVGIHREEREFGERVAQSLGNADIDVLRIEHGISNQPGGPGEAQFYYRTCHREIYLQLLQQVKNRYRLVIDLHSGLQEGGRYAEIYCPDNSLFTRLEFAFRALCRAGQMRIIAIVPDHNSEAIQPPCAKTLIPRQVWNNPAFGYVGLEVYLDPSNPAAEESLEFARGLVATISGCSH